MYKSLLDTDILSEVLKAKNPRVAIKAATYRILWGRFTISTLTILEVVKGFHKRQLTSHLNGFLSSLAAYEVLTLDVDSAILAARMDADLERTGQPIGRIDPMVASIALQNSLTLVTGNTAHYQRLIPLGYPLILDDWRN